MDTTSLPHTIWLQMIMGIKFDEIALNRILKITDFNLTKQQQLRRCIDTLLVSG